MKNVCLGVFGFMKIKCLSINLAYRAADSKSQCVDIELLVLLTTPQLLTIPDKSNFDEDLFVFLPPTTSRTGDFKGDPFNHTTSTVIITTTTTTNRQLY